MPESKGFRRKTRALLTKDRNKGLSYLLYDYKVGDKVIISIDPSTHKGMPHRRYHGRTGIIQEVFRRALLVSVPFGNKARKLYVRLEHVRPCLSR
jgi:large subunit ribosomal protein L21e